MYKVIIKPFFFLFNPERAHYLAMGILVFFSRIPGFGFLLKKIFTVSHSGLEKEVMGIKFPNPVGLAAGFDKNAHWIKQLPMLGFGFIEIGTVTPLAQSGNAKPRLFRLKKDNALVNRMGFNNDGIKELVKKLKEGSANIIIGGNIGKNTLTSNADAKSDYIVCFRELLPYVDYFVVNVSCPNVKGVESLQNKAFLTDLIQELHKIADNQKIYKPILLKISPDLSEIQLDEIIEIILETKIEGVVACNTSTERNGLKSNSEIINSAGNGGLSGKPLALKSTRTIQYLRKNSKKHFTIIGVGGIHSEKDAMEKLNAGADLIQIYTGFIYEGPSLPKRINKFLAKKCLK